MPFTPSHALAVLPLATGRPGRYLVPAALVIGSWIPDLPYFVPPHRGSAWTHSASGPVTVDLVLGLAVFALWELVMRRPLSDLAPAWLRSRLPAPSPLSPARWTAAAASVVVGAITHVVWDTFTHRDRWGTTHLAVLTALLGPLPAYKWFQFGSGVLGLAGLMLWLALWVRRTTPAPERSQVSDLGRGPAWSVLGGVFAVGLAVGALTRVAAGASVEAVAVGAATTSIGAVGAATVAVCLVWWLRSGGLLRHPGRVGQRPPQHGER